MSRLSVFLFSAIATGSEQNSIDALERLPRFLTDGYRVYLVNEGDAQQEELVKSQSYDGEWTEKQVDSIAKHCKPANKKRFDKARKLLDKSGLIIVIRLRMIK